MSVNDDGTEVIDVGKRGSRGHQIAQAGEEPGGVVVGEKRGSIEAKLAAAGAGRPVNISTRRVLGPPNPAVRAVRVTRKRGNPAGAIRTWKQRMLTITGASRVKPSGTLRPMSSRTPPATCKAPMTYK